MSSPEQLRRASLAHWPWFLVIAVLVTAGLVSLRPSNAIPLLSAAQPDDERRPAPELEGGAGWLNTADPIKIKDLRGKIVVLDFWTLCCINCIHTLPDLAKLEKKYSKELVVIGVHTAKFENEKKTDSIRKAIMRYEVKHPVVNDAEQKIWDAFRVHSWPTLILIDAEGKVVGRASGEGNYETLDVAIAKVIQEAKDKKILNEKPTAFQLAREAKATPLYFPGKVLADAAGKRLFIADSTHHRIVVTDLDGKKIDVIGVGTPGQENGDFDKASFNDPQGMALQGDTLFVADRKNHMIRSLDLKRKKVALVAGTGKQGGDRSNGGPARETGLNSPWDLYLTGDTLFIAMAGHHQIWKLDLGKEELEPFAGNGAENIVDGALTRSSFAQPSGLASDGKTLFVADSEVSAVRAVPLKGKGEVDTIVGLGLFKFGDVDGVGEDVRLQHALGLVFVDGVLYVADTYNSKIKIIDPAKKSSKTFLGGKGTDGPVFDEPGGISYADGKLYVADTNAHRIRVVDLKTKAVTTLALQGVEPPTK